MELTIDAGNTCIKIFNHATKQVTKILNDKDLERNLENFPSIDITSVRLISVVPSLTKLFIKKFGENMIHIVTHEDLHAIKYRRPQYTQVGIDRLVVINNAIKKYGANFVLIDFGTATTIEIIKDSVYVTGYIVPGVNIAHQALLTSAEGISNDEGLELEEFNFLVDSTLTAISSGTILAIRGLIMASLEAARTELDYEPLCILTGGYAIDAAENYIVDDNLIFAF